MLSTALYGDRAVGALRRFLQRKNAARPMMMRPMAAPTPTPAAASLDRPDFPCLTESPLRLPMDVADALAAADVGVFGEGFPDEGAVEVVASEAVGVVGIAKEAAEDCTMGIAVAVATAPGQHCIGRLVSCMVLAIIVRDGA